MMVQLKRSLTGIPPPKSKRKTCQREARVESDSGPARMAVGDMLKTVAGVDRKPFGHEITDSKPAHQDKVELAVLFRNIPCEIGPKGASGEFSIGMDPVK